MRHRARPCSGGCGATVHPDLVACPTCWAAVPERLRDAARAVSPYDQPAAFMDARAAAVAWLKARVEAEVAG